MSPYPLLGVHDSVSHMYFPATDKATASRRRSRKDEGDAPPKERGHTSEFEVTGESWVANQVPCESGVVHLVEAAARFLQFEAAAGAAVLASWCGVGRISQFTPMALPNAPQSAFIRTAGLNLPGVRRTNRPEATQEGEIVEGEAPTGHLPIPPA